MRGPEAHTTIRDAARAFEEALPPSQRKALGQFFTGIPLGRMLAHLAVDANTARVLDPMAGSGDLLDAACEAAALQGTALERIDAIEIDTATAAICEDRLRHICASASASPCVVGADAFDPRTYDTFPEAAYDLVITNPPYVRYQTLNGRADKARQGLSAIAEQRLTGAARDVWMTLAAGYSGLADLSIPAWLLSGLLVRPGGRLALVVPATWRSRAYADVIRYMLLRCFALETIVEDSQPGWFSDALVRTHLIVARRLSDEEIATPLSARADWSDARWIQVAPDAAASSSLVGNAFAGHEPEAAFAEWCRAEAGLSRHGIGARAFSLGNEWASLRRQVGARSWLVALEPDKLDLPQFAQRSAPAVSVPEALANLLPAGFYPASLCTLEDIGLRAGQGLRTGCNRFFYVRAVEEADQDLVRVMTNPAFGGQELLVPQEALRPVLHRQADLEAWRLGRLPATRVLDLRGWVLPEEHKTVRASAQAYQRAGKTLPQVMPEALAAFVRKAGTEPIGEKGNAKPVSELSAVRTNVRPARNNTPPRFWYMLPDFMPRHLPQAFVPRIIHGAPQVYSNADPPVLIDANFSTFWQQRQGWTAAALIAVLNSAWCRTAMEAVGTPLGGGALKLEAVHLRAMPVPRPDTAAIRNLDAAGQRQGGYRQQELIDRIVLGALLQGETSESELDAFAQALYGRLAALGAARQRGVA